jgi:hypothetical protein
MDLSNIMSSNLNDLRRTLNLNLLKSSMSTQAAQAIVIMEDFSMAQQEVKQATHPTLGKRIDIKG